MARKTEKPEMNAVVETALETAEMSAIENTVEETVEVATNETVVENANEVENQRNAVETATVENEEVDELEDLKNELIELNVDQLKSIIYRCEQLIEAINQDAVLELEAQMREIQTKLMRLKGNRLALEETTGTKKSGRPVVNPKNPSETWGGFGMRPDWLKELVKSANGDKIKERKILNNIRAEQAAK